MTGKDNNLPVMQLRDVTKTYETGSGPFLALKEGDRVIVGTAGAAPGAPGAPKPAAGQSGPRMPF